MFKIDFFNFTSSMGWVWPSYQNPSYICAPDESQTHDLSLHLARRVRAHMQSKLHVQDWLIKYLCEGHQN